MDYFISTTYSMLQFQSLTLNTLMGITCWTTEIIFLNSLRGHFYFPAIECTLSISIVTFPNELCHQWRTIECITPLYNILTLTNHVTTLSFNMKTTQNIQSRAYTAITRTHILVSMLMGGCWWVKETTKVDEKEKRRKHQKTKEGVRVEQWSWPPHDVHTALIFDLSCCYKIPA